MMTFSSNNSRAQMVGLMAAATVLTHLLCLIGPSLAVNSGGGGGGSAANSEATSSTQPLWSYQVKPTSYLGSQSAPSSHYAAPLPPASSLFDAFTSLSQRQGALTSSPFMSILPIILIAAGGLLLLLPMLTMMMASPFGGGGGPFGGGAGFGGGFGYPQVGALSKRRSLDQQQHQRGLIELIEHVSTTIEDLSRRYAPSAQAGAAANNNQQAAAAAAAQQTHKRLAKAMLQGANSHPATSTATNEAAQLQQTPSNHKPTEESNVVGATSA